jgi:hypothetical protein
LVIQGTKMASGDNEVLQQILAQLKSQDTKTHEKLSQTVEDQGEVIANLVIDIAKVVFSRISTTVKQD